MICLLASKSKPKFSSSDAIYFSIVMSSYVRRACQQTANTFGLDLFDLKIATHTLERLHRKEFLREFRSQSAHERGCFRRLWRILMISENLPACLLSIIHSNEKIYNNNRYGSNLSKKCFDCAAYMHIRLYAYLTFTYFIVV